MNGMLLNEKINISILEEKNIKNGGESDRY